MSEQAEFNLDQIAKLRAAGRDADAATHCLEYLHAHPLHTGALLQLADILAAGGRALEAVHFCRRAVVADENSAPSYAALGHTLAATRQYTEAADAFHAAVRLDPSAQNFNNLAAVLMMSGRPEDAIDPLRRSLVIQPESPDALFNLAMALGATDNHALAVEPLRNVVRLDPTRVPAWQQLGRSLRATDQWAESLDAFQHSLTLAHATADTLVHIGECLLQVHRPDEAIAPLTQALELDPNYAPAYGDLGTALIRVGQLDEARQYLERAVVLEPDHAIGHINLGLCLLHHGEFERGWREYEWRWKMLDIDAPRLAFLQPQWVGQPVQGKTVFVYSEGGFGDTVQFIRYAPLLRDRGAKVVLSCPPELKRLLTEMRFGEVVTTGDKTPEIDFHSSLLSLPIGFDTTLETIPANVPYITANDDDQKRWKSRLASDTAKLKVGLLWQGRAEYRLDKFRSLAPELLEPLVRAKGVSFYSLQKGEASREAAKLGLIDHTADLRDFADTAALIDNLDLVITPDTAVAHLAGAMGKPTWVLIWYCGEWRWLRNRTDSPWYPTLRLFYQSKLGDWSDVIERVRDELIRLRDG